MSRNETKPSTSLKSKESTADTKIDKKTDKPKKKRSVIESFRVALKKASESKDKNIAAKIGVFFTAFFKEYFGLQKEEQKITDETNKAIDKSVQETLKGAKEKLKFKNLDQKEEELFDESLSLGIDSMKSMEKGQQAYFYNAMTKLSNGEKVNSYNELAASSAVSLMTLSKLKQKHSNKKSFKKALSDLQKISKKSSFLKNLFSKDSLSLFKIDDQGEAIKFLSAFGIDIGLSDGFAKLGLSSGGPATQAKELFSKIGTANPAEREELAKFLIDNKILKHSSKSEVESFVDTLNEIPSAKSQEDYIDLITNLVFSIDDKDYKHIVTKLVGKNNL